MNNATHEPKKLYKSEKDKMVSGILAGIAEYFVIDPNIIRLSFIVILLVSGIFPGILAYVIAYFIIPDAPRNGESSGMPFLKTEPRTTPPEPEQAPKEEEKI